MSTNLSGYWAVYNATLARVRAEKPTTFAGLKLILDVFSEPSAGDAFFPDGADDTLARALIDTGWSLDFEEGSYLYTATHPQTGAVIRYMEGDLYCYIGGRS